MTIPYFFSEALGSIAWRRGGNLGGNVVVQSLLAPVALIIMRTWRN